MQRNLILILGNQLFDPRVFPTLKVDPSKSIIFMREDRELASYYRFHKHKIIFFFAAMREYKRELEQAGYVVHYEVLGNDSRTYDQALSAFIETNKVQKVSCFEIEDKFFEKRISECLKQQNVTTEFWPSPMFLTSRTLFKKYLGSHKKPFMKTFYEMQRKRLNVLLENDGPVGGQWSFDTQNRKSLPKTVHPPELPSVAQSIEVAEVQALVEKEFADHSGEVSNFWLPVTRQGAKDWLARFLDERLYDFGPYEDAIPSHSETLYHSVLTPFLNTGLLTPRYVIHQTLKYHERHPVPLTSLEGFIRQIIGWREFIRGIYQNFSDVEESTNFWQHKKKLTQAWYAGNTGVPALDRAIQHANKRAYGHHIERLMVIGNLMLLLEVDPKEAHRWFMEMFLDSSDWVMGPNVYGMALFSDGGVFATKPYICGSNYLRKMSGDPVGEWCDEVDGVYWCFIRKHRDYFSKNPRLAMMSRSAEKISAERWKVLESGAKRLRERLVCDI